jgi:hypothetical protein
MARGDVCCGNRRQMAWTSELRELSPIQPRSRRCNTPFRRQADDLIRCGSRAYRQLVSVTTALRVLGETISSLSRWRSPGRWVKRGFVVI